MSRAVRSCRGWRGCAPPTPPAPAVAPFGVPFGAPFVGAPSSSIIVAPDVEAEVGHQGRFYLVLAPNVVIDFGGNRRSGGAGEAAGISTGQLELIGEPRRRVLEGLFDGLFGRFASVITVTALSRSAPVIRSFAGMRSSSTRSASGSSRGSMETFLSSKVNRTPNGSTGEKFVFVWRTRMSSAEFSLSYSSNSNCKTLRAAHALYALLIGLLFLCFSPVWSFPSWSTKNGVVPSRLKGSRYFL